MNASMPLQVLLAALLIAAGTSRGDEGSSKSALPLERAHAHNDYRHERPLLDALHHGFSSVEADIFLVDGKLLVGHDRSELRPGRTLEKLYLDPLLERVRRNRGRVHPKGPEFTLLIDFKSEGKSTYASLRKVLARYREMLTTVTDGKRMARAVTVVISGNRPWEEVAADSPRYAGVDGRLSDLDSDKSAHLMPLVSDNWRNHFKWRGDGPMPAEERSKLRGIVERAHRKGWRVRFWATPEKESIWKELLAAEVDHINTDDLRGLRNFLTASKKRS